MSLSFLSRRVLAVFGQLASTCYRKFAVSWFKRPGRTFRPHAVC